MRRSALSLLAAALAVGCGGVAESGEAATEPSTPAQLPMPAPEPETPEPETPEPETPEAEPRSWEEITAAGFEIVVHKGDRRMTVVSPPGDDGAVVRSYRIGLGFDPVGDKERQGDGRTPEGSFTITRLVPHSQYYKAFLINYPALEDADRGVSDGIISESTAQSIRRAHSNRTTPPQYTDLGGLIEIHGMGGSSDWTLGCVAADNEVIDELWPHTKVGTTVRIVR